MLSRRALFGLGLSRVAERIEEQLDEQRLHPSPPPPKRRVPARPPGVPPPAPSWPHRRGAELWGPVTEALPRPEGAHVLEVDELDSDVAQLALPDEEYDVAVSAFAPMFSSDPAAAIAELFRVVRYGGLVAFCVWTPAGIVGKLLELAEELEPFPGPGGRPMAWGREERLRSEVERHSDDFELRSLGLTLEFDSAEEALATLTASLRPLAWAPNPEALRRHGREIVGDAEGPVQLRATYLMALARRRPA
jgi:SAM-dependent methyltransferase